MREKVVPDGKHHQYVDGRVTLVNTYNENHLDTMKQAIRSVPSHPIRVVQFRVTRSESSSSGSPLPSRPIPSHLLRVVQFRVTYSEPFRVTSSEAGRLFL